ncbi:MAG: hypothetical protein QGD91_12630, partial [Actinomycetota bacterium]|nr:hypothetical protein [Actinomycetota bacterium]
PTDLSAAHGGEMNGAIIARTRPAYHFKGENEMKLKTHIVVTTIVLGHLALPVATTHAGGIRVCAIVS